VGCGADELIDLLMRCVLDPGDRIIDCPPTFTMYAFDAAVNGAEVITVPRVNGFRIDATGECSVHQMPLHLLSSSLALVVSECALYSAPTWPADKES
jgi:histidinol-phosphate/aromatic aminotransferase/cobyric acid decarboxylase-like protein